MMGKRTENVTKRSAGALVHGDRPMSHTMYMARMPKLMAERNTHGELGGRAMARPLSFG
jgi:hypothetical protein